MATQVPKIEIVSPLQTDKFMISPAPAMPVIIAEARVTGMSPDPTSKTLFKWTASIELDAATCSNGPHRKIAHAPVSQTITGGKFTPPFSQIRGGLLTLEVEAQVAGKTMKASVTNIKIVGTNPSSQAIAVSFPDITLRQIACQESGLRQFASSNMYPLWSGDKLGGVGLMQITNPKPTDDEVWDWTANMAGGEKLLKEKRAIAKAYPGKVRNSTQFQSLISKLNQARQKDGKSALSVTLPEFTDDELRLDTIRGHNGFAGNDGFGNVLHEFRVPLDAKGNIVVVEQPDGKSAAIEWQRVPASDRPRSGDPDYVNHVIGQAV